MKYYHATTEEAARGIVTDKMIRKSWDGGVYLADSMENAYKFTALRAFGQPLFIFEIDGLDESKIEESFDHSEAFFKCRAYIYFDDIPTSKVSNIFELR